MIFVQLVAVLNAQGKTLKGHLQSLFEKWILGVHSFAHI